MPDTSARTDPVSHWERLLQAAARLQAEIEDAVLAGGTAAAVWAAHRYSYDADHVLKDLQHRFDMVLAQLAHIDGWTTARIRRPVLILGALDGIDTGLRQLRRPAPLETTLVTQGSIRLRVPTHAEILRIKGYLVVTRNATRDYVDYIELARALSLQALHHALAPLDSLYALPELRAPGGEASVLHELGIRLGAPHPQDLDTVQWHDFRRPESSEMVWDWDRIQRAALDASVRTLQVHDDLLAQCPAESTDAAARKRPLAEDEIW